MSDTEQINIDNRSPEERKTDFSISSILSDTSSSFGKFHQSQKIRCNLDLSNRSFFPSALEKEILLDQGLFSVQPFIGSSRHATILQKFPFYYENKSLNSTEKKINEDSNPMLTINPRWQNSSIKSWNSSVKQFNLFPATPQNSHGTTSYSSSNSNIIHRPVPLRPLSESSFTPSTDYGQTRKDNESHIYTRHKLKRLRTAFSTSQMSMLEKTFNNRHYVIGERRKELASILGLSETQVKVWFQNRRTKHKKLNQDSNLDIDSFQL